MKIVNEPSNRSFLSTKQGKIALGVALAFAGAAMEALADVIPKPLMAETQISPAAPLMIVFLIYMINGIIFTPFTAKSKPLFKFPKKSLYALTGLGVADVLATVFFLYGLKDTSAINASILGNSEIVFGIIIAMIVLGERIQRKEVFPFVLIGIGAILIPTWSSISEYGFMTNFVIGDFMILVSGVFLGIVMTMYKQMGDEFDSKRIIQYTSFIGAAVAMAGILVMNIPFEIDPDHLPIIFVTGIVGVGLPILLLVISLRYIGAVVAILIFSATSVFGVLFSHVLLGEIVSIENVAAVSLIIVGTYFLRKKLAQD